MGKNRRNRHKKCVPSVNQVPIIIATSTADDLSDSSNQVELTLPSPKIIVKTPDEDETQTEDDDRAQKVLEEVKRRKAIAEAAVRSKTTAKPHNRIIFYPFAYALCTENLHLFCWYCLKEYDQVHLRPCSAKCNVAWFCNNECEKLALKDHRPECDGYKQMSSDSEAPDVEVRLLGRIAYRYKQIRDGQDQSIEDFYKERTSKRTVMEIWSHESKFARNPDCSSRFAELYEKLVSFYADQDLPSKEEVFKLHCRAFINRHAISDVHYQNEIGKGLYLDLCSYDHSCRPDTIFYSTSFKSVLVGLEPNADISDNKKSFYSYVDLMGTFSQRQKQLRDTWFFDCNCKRCLDPYDHVLTALKCQFCFEIDNMETPVILQGERALKANNRICCSCCERTQESFHLLEANYLMRDIGVFMDQVDSGQLTETETKFKELLVKADYLLPSVNTYKTRLILGYVNLPNISADDRIKMFISTESCLRYCFPCYHPGLGFYLRDVAYFCADAQLFEEAIDYVNESLDIMERVFIEHEVVDNLRQKLSEYQRKAALQKEAGKTRRLRDLIKLSTNGDDPFARTQLLVAETKTSHGSTKDRAHHRRTHRAPTPLPPVLLEEEVQFSITPDN